MPSPYWLWLAGLCFGLVHLLPYFYRRQLHEDRYGKAENVSALVVFSVIMLTSAAIQFVAVIKSYTPGQHALWWVALVVSVVFLIGYGYVALEINEEYHTSVIIVVMLALLASVTVTLIKALDDNSYRLTQGHVIDQGYVPAHITPLVCSGKPIVCTGGHYVADDWSLTLRDCETYDKCVDGTLHFSNQYVLESYPIGSYYP